VYDLLARASVVYPIIISKRAISYNRDKDVQSLSLDQLRAATRAGGITSVTLRAEGGAFVVAVATRSGDRGLLVTTRTKQPRRFADLRKAMLLLREMGIASVQVDATHWKPDEATAGAPRPDRSEAMKRAHEAAAHDRWFRAQVEEALQEVDDPATVSIPHEQVMAEMKAIIDRAAPNPSGRRAR
jgi:hypothetical protein